MIYMESRMPLVHDFKVTDNSSIVVKTSRLKNITKDYYYNNILLSAIKSGDWVNINNMPIAFDDDGNAICYFYEDNWLFDNILYSGKKEYDSNIYFNPMVKGERYDLDYNIKSQVKCYALCLILYSRKNIKLSSIADKVSRLVSMSYIFTQYGVNDLGDIALENLMNWSHDKLNLAESSGNRISVLNELGEYSDYLPFDWKVTKKITLKGLGLTVDSQKQTLVIPSRIYIGLLDYCSSVVNEVFGYREELELAVEKMLKWQESYRSYVKGKLASYRDVNSNVLKLSEIKSCFKSQGVSIYDVKNNLWDDIWSKSKPVYRLSKSWLNKNKFIVKVGTSSFNSTESFKHFMNKVDHACKWISSALSGMRIDELIRLPLQGGCQKYLMANERNIYAFTTKQSKITFSSQLKDDVFVTTETGYKAYSLLCSLHSPFNKRYVNKNDRESMFASLNFSWSPKAINKRSLSTSISNFVNKKGNSNNPVDMVLRVEDIADLNSSDPDNEYQEGDVFIFTPHQLRRSLAFYTVGYELLSYQQLKQQLGHYSMSMTMWYARNSSSINKVYKEVENERLHQKSQIISSIYKKVADGKPIAGGKGKALIREVESTEGYYFKSDVNKRKVSRQYWEKELKNNKVHIHAIAPGVYCTNSKCSLRINIDLSGCVDCEFDYIENAAYIESTRLKAIGFLNHSIQKDFKNINDISRWVVQIKSAERILDDLELEYESFKIPSEISKLLIPIKAGE